MTVENVKKVKLGNYPTPLEKMENMTKFKLVFLSINLMVKYIMLKIVLLRK